MYKPSKQTFIMEDIQEKYNHLLQQNEALRQENEELESLLHAHGIEYKPKHAEEKDAVYSPCTFPYVKLSIEERVAVFHSLFKGREDVFARRWFSKTTGKSGYQPVCINEWRRGVCDKTVCKDQIFNGRTFFRPYSSSIGDAKRSIVVSSPKLYRVERSVLVNQLSELAHIGIEVLVITTASNPETEYLLQRGLSVRILPASLPAGFYAFSYISSAICVRYFASTSLALF